MLQLLAIPRALGIAPFYLKDGSQYKVSRLLLVFNTCVVIVLFAFHTVLAKTTAEAAIFAAESNAGVKFLTAGLYDIFFGYCAAASVFSVLLKNRRLCLFLNHSLQVNRLLGFQFRLIGAHIKLIAIICFLFLLCGINFYLLCSFKNSGSITLEICFSVCEIYLFALDMYFLILFSANHDTLKAVSLLLKQILSKPEVQSLRALRALHFKVCRLFGHLGSDFSFVNLVSVTACFLQLTFSAYYLTSSSWKRQVHEVAALGVRFLYYMIKLAVVSIKCSEQQLEVSAFKTAVHS